MHFALLSILISSMRLSVIEYRSISQVSSITGLILSFQAERMTALDMKAFILSPAASLPFSLKVITASGVSNASPGSSTQVSISGFIPHTMCVIPCSVTEADMRCGPE